MVGIVADDADGLAVHPGKADDNVFGVIWHKLEKFPSVNYVVDHVQHVVSCGGIQRYNGLQTRHRSIPWISRAQSWGLVLIGIYESLFTSKVSKKYI